MNKEEIIKELEKNENSLRHHLGELRLAMKGIKWHRKEIDRLAVQLSELTKESK